MTNITMNGQRMTIRKARDTLDELSAKGWFFKRLPGYDGQELYLAFKQDNPLTSYPIEIKGITPSIIFNKLQLAMS